MIVYLTLGELKQVTPDSAILADPRKGHETAAQVAAEREDCLYLNVYAPAQPSCKARAVMFWIHGGDLMSGTSSAFDGTSFAAHQDVVVVTINYRVNGITYSRGNLGRGTTDPRTCSLRLLQRAQSSPRVP